MPPCHWCANCALASTAAVCRHFNAAASHRVIAAHPTSDCMPTSVEITLRNMRFHVCVGILPHEAEFAQPLEIDLTVWAAATATGTIGVDYRDLYAVASAVVSQGPLSYLEAIAQRIVDGAIARPNVLAARVAIRKPHVALPGPLDHAEVVVEGGVRA